MPRFALSALSEVFVLVPFHFYLIHVRHLPVPQLHRPLTLNSRNMPRHTINSQVVRWLRPSYNLFHSLLHAPCVWWLHAKFFPYLDSGRYFLISIQGHIFWVPPLIDENWTLWYRPHSLSDLRPHIVPKRRFDRQYLSSFSYCFHSSMVSLSCSIPHLTCTLLCNAFLFSIFRATFGRIPSEKSFHCPLLNLIQNHRFRMQFPPYHQSPRSTVNDRQVRIPAIMLYRQLTLFNCLSCQSQQDPARSGQVQLIDI